MAASMMRRGRTGSLILPWIAPIILAAVATHQLYTAHTRQLTSWKGGGFGMFATIDRPRCRALRAYMTTEAGAVALRLGAATGLRRRWMDLAVTDPSQRRLRVVANELRRIQWVLREGPDDGALSFEGVCSTVTPATVPSGPVRTRQQLYPPDGESSVSGNTAPERGPIRLEILRVHFESATRRVRLSQLAALQEPR